jgi:hypothetical protein
MTRSQAFAAALFALQASLLGCGANLAAQRSSISSSPQIISEVRLGHGLDIVGKVPPCLGASRFTTGDPIHLSLWQVASEGAGAVRLSIREALTSQVVWSEEKASRGGGSYLTFEIGRALPSGTYRAEVIVGEDVMSRTGFEVRPSSRR